MRETGFFQSFAELIAIFDLHQEAFMFLLLVLIWSPLGRLIEYLILKILGSINRDTYALLNDTNILEFDAKLKAKAKKAANGLKTFVSISIAITILGIYFNFSSFPVLKPPDILPTTPIPEAAPLKDVSGKSDEDFEAPASVPEEVNRQSSSAAKPYTEYTPTKSNYVEPLPDDNDISIEDGQANSAAACIEELFIVPDVTGLSTEDAVSIIWDRGLNVTVNYSDSQYISEQSPSAGTTLEADETVVLWETEDYNSYETENRSESEYSDSAGIPYYEICPAVPCYVGCLTSDAYGWLVSAGFNVYVVNSDRSVYGQWYEDSCVSEQSSWYDYQSGSYTVEIVTT